MPCIVRDMDDDTAIILMVDSNCQREHILPSEKAKAYEMKLEAIRRKAGRPSKENSRQVVGDFESADLVGQASGESGRQVQRFIRLNKLTPELMKMVDKQYQATLKKNSYVDGKFDEDLYQVLSISFLVALSKFKV